MVRSLIEITIPEKDKIISPISDHQERHQSQNVKHKNNEQEHRKKDEATGWRLKGHLHIRHCGNHDSK